MSSYPPLEIKVWGDFACFTRPEMKVERVSYDVMTPSAARAVLESIFWKPQFDYIVDEILVLNPVKKISLLRNEVKSKIACRTVEKWATTGGHYDVEQDRTQRHGLLLRDVAYIIRAQIRLRPGVTDGEAKYRDQFRRRLKKGRCFWRPYLGCREFSAFFSEPEDMDAPIEWSTDLGRMLFDLAYDDSRGKTQKAAVPHFFQARVDRGVLQIPRELYDPLLSQKESR